MHPQFAAWEAGPHSRIACVSCHIGEGPGGFIHAKLSGVRQLVQVATTSYPRPIPPGAHMPEGEQARTCSSCHSPATRNVGDQVRVVREYADDEGNSETKTVLQMYLGPGSPSGRNIHWHADPSIRVEYVSTDAANETIPLVRVTNAAGEVKEYVTEGTKPETIAAGTRRTMDCIDCHNTVGHPIAPSPELAVDRAIGAGLISRQLPNARREAVRLVSATYSTQDDGAATIERELGKIFQPASGKIDQQEVARSVAAVRDLYRRSVFPSMKVTFGSYPTNRGHSSSTGCFRCHDSLHAAKDGSVISDDCEYCHKDITPQ
jgi:formate-dependent nitrite reductase cytochrome c552 subunit